MSSFPLSLIAYFIQFICVCYGINLVRVEKSRKKKKHPSVGKGSSCHDSFLHTSRSLLNVPAHNGSAAQLFPGAALGWFHAADWEEDWLLPLDTSKALLSLGFPSLSCGFDPLPPTPYSRYTAASSTAKTAHLR